MKSYIVMKNTPLSACRWFFVLLTVLALCSRVSLSHAATFVWNNPVSGTWDTANNWTPNLVPGAADTAIITNAGVTVSLASSLSVSNIVLGTNGPGTVTLALSGRILTLNGTISVNPSGLFSVNPGDILNGNSTAVLTGPIGWNGGQLEGTLTLAPGGTLNIGTANVHDLPSLIFTNNGTVVWATGGIRGGGTPASTIYNNGLWNIQDDSIWDFTYGGAGTVFNNAGILRKSGGSTSGTVFQHGVVLNQLAGDIDVQSNLQLLLQGGGTFTGGYTTTNSQGLIELNSGLFTLNGGQTTTNVIENNGTLVGANVIGGGLTWISGTWNGSLSETIAPNATVLITSGNTHNLESCTITNNGTVVWVTGEISGGGNPGTLIYNNGLWVAADDSTWDNNYSGAGTLFYSAGTFRKSGGNSATGSTLFSTGVILEQTGGALDVQNGTNGLQLTLHGGAQLDGGYVTTNSAGVILLNANTFSVNGTVTTTNVIENQANLAGTNVFRGAFTWQNGPWNGAIATIASGCTLVIDTQSGTHNLAGTIITNYGTVNWSNDTLNGGGGMVINNYGVWNAQDDQTMNEYFGTPVGVFNNYGTFRKSGGSSAGQTLIGNPLNFNNWGVIDVQNGTSGLNLSLQGNDNFWGGYCTTNASGMIYLATGNFNINGTVTSPSVIENPGNLTGTNVIRGTLVWQVGNWGGTVVTVATNATLVINSATGGHNLSGTILTNYGTVDWSSDTLVGGNGFSVFNYGLWNAQDDQALNNYYGNPGTFFNNYGTFRKSGGTNASETLIGNYVTFNNAGVIDVQSGVGGLNLWFEGNDTFNGGSFTMNPGGYTYLFTGTFNINGTVTTTNVIENDADMIGTNVLRGGFTWQDGQWSGDKVTIATNCLVLMVTPSGNHTLNGTTLTNYGIVDWSGDALSGGNTMAIYNYGLWNAQDDQVFDNFFGGTSTVFDNFGTFRKTGTSGGSSQIQSGVTFNNRGKLDAQAGNISLQGTYSLTNGTLNFGLNGTTNSGTISLAGAAALTGTVSANLNNGYYPQDGNSFTNIFYASHTGIFTNTAWPAGIVWSTNYYPTYFVLSVVSARPIMTSLFTSKTNLLITWPTNYLGWELQIQTNTLGHGLGTNWVTYAGSMTTNSENILVVHTNPAVFFRMANP